MKKIFVTGTDTDAGKTWISAALLHRFSEAGQRCIGLKPVAAGCEKNESGDLRNSDALLLQNYMSESLPYEQVNPVAFEEPVAPHLAAQRAGRHVTLQRLIGLCRGVELKRPDVLLIEGAGGWRVPLNEQEMLSGLAVELQTEVVLVVGLKLGCISHALLTAEAIMRDGLKLAGWIANQASEVEMDLQQENIATLTALIPAPCLGVVPHTETIEDAALKLEIDALLP
ncbi:MAG: dethiobiotin synthase [Pseudomonadales bacterium]|nr:dethiobiotin synthase [Pseudomonadales bacterium]